MEKIRSWWEVPCVAHYCHIFQKAFKLPPVEIEELEDALLLDYSPNPSTLLVELYCIFLNGIVDKEINTDNWEFFLKLHFEWRCDHLGLKWNPFAGDKSYKDLSTRSKVEVLHKLCHWRLELDDIADLLRGVDGPTLRLDPLGRDQDGNTYWHFFGMRLYKEEPKKRKKKEAVDESSTSKRGRGKSTPGKSGKVRGTPARRGKGKEQNSVEDNEQQSDTEDPSSLENTGWSVMFDDLEEWTQFTESFARIKLKDVKVLYSNLVDLLPHIEYLSQVRDRDRKKKLLAALPRRTSDRIATKAAEKDEMEKLLALERELEREEWRKIEAEEARVAEEEADRKRQQRREEALQRRKVREEQQAKQREAEEEHWEKAMSGELTGRRRAAIGAARSVSTVTALGETLLVEERNELYTAMYKILSGLRSQEDSWVFEDPVTEAIAPGYFEVIDTPMDYSTVEKRIESHHYKDKEEFARDLELIFNNCLEYNGEDSEYAELAKEMLSVLANLQKVHFDGEVQDPAEEEDVGPGRKKKRDHSPSPELTSESSSEEESDDSDESYEEGSRLVKKRRTMKDPATQTALKLPPGFDDKLGALRPHRPFPPHMNPYHQLMQQRMPPHMFPTRDPTFRLPPPYPGQRPPLYRPEMRMPYHGQFSRPIMGPDGRPMVGPNGRPMMGPDGRPMMGPDGRPMMASPDGRPMMGPDGRPMMGPDGRSMMAPPDGRPTMGPDGRPMMAPPDGRPTMGPDGRPMMAPPDGRPMMGPDGRPTVSPDGRPTMGPDGRPMMAPPDGRPTVGPDGRPTMGPDGRPTMGPDGRPMMVPPDGRPTVGPDGRPMMGPDGRPTMASPDGRPMMGQDGRPMMGPDGRPMMGPDGRPMMGSDGRPMMGPDGRPMMGPDGRPMMGPDGRPVFPAHLPPHHPMTRQAAYYHQMMMHRNYRHAHSMAQRQHSVHSGSPGLQTSSPSLPSTSPGPQSRVAEQSSSPNLQQASSPQLVPAQKPVTSPQQTGSPQSGSPAQAQKLSPAASQLTGDDRPKGETPSTDEGHGSSPRHSTSSVDPDQQHSQAELRQRYQAEQYERYRQHMMAMQHRGPPYPGGGYGYPLDRASEEMMYYAWKGGYYPQDMDYMQQQQRYWQEMEMRQAYEAMLRHRAPPHEHKQGMPADYPPHNGEKSSEPPPGSDRPSERPHPLPGHPPMNGYGGMMDYPSFPPPNNVHGYGYKPPYPYPYPPQQGMSGPPSKPPPPPQNGTSEPEQGPSAADGEQS